MSTRIHLDHDILVSECNISYETLTFLEESCCWVVAIMSLHGCQCVLSIIVSLSYFDMVFRWRAYGGFKSCQQCHLYEMNG